MCRRPLATVALFFVFWLIAVTGLLHLKLDLSFRPLFATGAIADSGSREFEAVFGQPSGAFVIYIIENDDVLNPTFIRELDGLSQIAQETPGVIEVVSLTTLRIPVWWRDELRLVPLVPVNSNDSLLKNALANLNGRLTNRLISESQRYTLIAARLEPPMEDLVARRSILAELTGVLRQNLPGGSALFVSGVSVVEIAFADHILFDQLMATSFTMLALALLLWLLFRQWRAVLVCLAPVAVAVPASIGLLAWVGQPITIINSVVPVIILVIGVADAVHMVVAWLRRRENGVAPSEATRDMLRYTGGACALTTVTTMAGFLALMAAKLDVIRVLGVAAAIGILFAWFANQVLIPRLLQLTRPLGLLPDDPLNRGLLFTLTSAIRLATLRPMLVVSASLVMVVLMASVIPQIQADQKFNQELPRRHPVRHAQELLEREFGGFLGPELVIRRRDGETLLDRPTLEKVSSFSDAVLKIPDTHSVSSLQDLLTGVSIDATTKALRAMEESSELKFQVRERVNPQRNQLVILVRTGDMGTDRAGEYRDELLSLADQIFGTEYRAEVVGQWWLAQQGMRLILGDMLRSIGTALLVVLPILWIGVRKWRLFFAAAIANLVPLLLPLSFMAVTGIPIRIGTAVVLAIALGIAVDNTIHVINRLRMLSESSADPVAHIREMMQGTGRAVIYTTIAFVAGFLSMLTNQLLVIRDMGLVAAVTFVGALVADLLLLPAVYILVRKIEND